MNVVAIKSDEPFPVHRELFDVNRLWEQRLDLVQRSNQLWSEEKDANDKLPEWAKPGPRLLAHDGSYTGTVVGWPLDVNVTPPDHRGAYRICRLSTFEVKENFDFHVRLFPKMSAKARAAHRATMRASLKKVIARLRAQREEEKRLGIPELERLSKEVNDARWLIEDSIRDCNDTPNAKAANVMLHIQSYCRLDSSADDDSEMELACLPFEMLLPQLSGIIRAHVQFYLDNRTTKLRDMPFALL